jgi:transcriptional regulator with XRE-family HTH domain
MSFTGPSIRTLRQRLGWSVAEMARRMGCNTRMIQSWERETAKPDADALNQLRYLQNYVESYSEHIAQNPQVEKAIEDRHVAQLTHRDLLKDLQ